MQSAMTHQESLVELVKNDIKINEALQQITVEYRGTEALDAAAMQQLVAACGDHGLKVEVLRDGNNKVISISNTEHAVGVIVQLGMKDIEALVVTKQLYPAKWLPVIYKDSSEIVMDRMDRKNEVKTKMARHRTLMEFCPGDIKKLAIANSQLPVEERDQIYASVANVARQMADILTEINDKEIMWPDMKPDNILFRLNGEVVICDTKPFRRIENLDRVTKTNAAGEEYKIFKFHDMTTHFISPDGQSRLFTIPERDRKKLLEIWKREYSYQLAIVLYRVATGDLTDPERNINNDDKYEMTFDFNHPIFQAGAGRKLQAILEHMTKPNPKERLDCSAAARKLKKLILPVAVKSPRAGKSPRAISPRSAVSPKTTSQRSASRLFEAEVTPPMRMGTHRGSANKAQKK